MNQDDINVNLNKIEDMIIDSEKDQIFNHLANDESIIFKLQQRHESDLTVEEKIQIASDLYQKNKLSFLVRFGKYLNPLHLDHFKKILNESEDSFEIQMILNDLQRNTSKTHNIDVKNRRYEALQQLIRENSYFSEVEMMKRNPLLYEQLVGQYLTEEEKYERDRYKKSDLTLVKVLLEGIERDNAKLTQKVQEDLENSMMEEEDSEDDENENEKCCQKSNSPQPSTSTLKWGEFEEDKRPTFRNAAGSLTETEREILKEEFVTTMYQNFLDGKDKDFNYDEVDNNSKYDNTYALDQDAEDKYFDSEEPETVEVENQSSEDELDIYMNALNQHPTVLELAKDVKKM